MLGIELDADMVANFGRFADEALSGHPILIVRKSRLLVLQEYSISEPIPIRPEGYFNDAYTKQEARTSNRLASRGPRKTVR